MATSWRVKEYARIDKAVDEVLSELHKRGTLSVRSNPASNARDALISELNARGFDVVRKR